MTIDHIADSARRFAAPDDQREWSSLAEPERELWRRVAAWARHRDSESHRRSGSAGGRASAQRLTPEQRRARAARANAARWGRREAPQDPGPSVAPKPVATQPAPPARPCRHGTPRGPEVCAICREENLRRAKKNP